MQGLSNSAWAFAKLGFSSPMLFEALAEAAVGKLDAFTPQGLSNTAWAYATVGHYHPALMQQLAEQVSRCYVAAERRLAHTLLACGFV